MANKIIPKRSSVSGKAPVAADLDVGEIAVNLTDRKIYTKDATNAVVQLGGGSGSGDVIGPATATDNAIVRFDGATGKIVKNSGATVDDSGNLAATTSRASGTGANKMPVGTTAQRPTGEAGLYRMNSETGEPEWFNTANSQWVPFADKSKLTADYLVIAGGGGGGHYSGGGGGAGGYLEGAGLTLNTGQAYTVTVGAGGVRGTSSQTQTNGSNSVFGTIAATGGGYGSNVGGGGNNGGSGGGGGGLSGGVGGTGISGQGNGGGTGYPGRQLGGGGGGANAAGNNYNSGTVAGSGGGGKTSSITGSAVTRAGGGGGGSQDIYSGAGGGGSGGGGSGGFAAAGSSGADNYGGGGGGGGNNGGTGQNGGNGGSGVVILRIPNKFSAAFSAGVTVSTDSTSVAGFKIYTVTAGTGTVTFAEA